MPNLGRYGFGNLLDHPWSKIVEVPWGNEVVVRLWRKIGLNVGLS
jgi:hypothetical protein